MTRSEPLSTAFSIDGGSIPALGLSTFPGNEPDSRVANIVHKALIMGYRLIDTAAIYGNEEAVKAGIRMSEVPREEICVIAKLDPTCHAPDDVEKSLDRSLQQLGLRYVDFFLMHSPYALCKGSKGKPRLSYDWKLMLDQGRSRAYLDTWRAMERLVDTGKTKHIGVANFNARKLRCLLERARIKPAVNEIELHPYLPQTELLEMCREAGIHVIAHQPLGGPIVYPVFPTDDDRPLENPEIEKLANRNRRTSAQLILAWLTEQGVTVVPRTTRVIHLYENSQLKRVPSAAMAAMSSLSRSKGARRVPWIDEYFESQVFGDGKDPWTTRIEMMLEGRMPPPEYL